MRACLETHTEGQKEFKVIHYIGEGGFHGTLKGGTSATETKIIRRGHSCLKNSSTERLIFLGTHTFLFTDSVCSTVVIQRRWTYCEWLPTH